SARRGWSGRRRPSLPRPPKWPFSPASSSISLGYLHTANDGILRWWRRCEDFGRSTTRINDTSLEVRHFPPPRGRRGGAPALACLHSQISLKHGRGDCLSNLGLLRPVWWLCRRARMYRRTPTLLWPTAARQPIPRNQSYVGWAKAPGTADRFMR